jgi:hypothetical protein
MTTFFPRLCDVRSTVPPLSLGLSDVVTASRPRNYQCLRCRRDRRRHKRSRHPLVNGEHVDRGEALTRWSIMQILVGHFFVQNGYFLLALSSFVLISLWVVVGVHSALSRMGLQIGEMID